MTNPNEPDPFLAHEALDRTSMLAEMVEDYLMFHPYVDRNKDVQQLIEQACDALAKAYQLIGSKTP
jgi:hypothetical protein